MRCTLSQAAVAALATLASASLLGRRPKGPSNNGKTCTVKPLGHQRDDTPQILRAFEKCNHGGTVVFPQGENYWIGTKLNPVVYDITVDWKGVWTVCMGCHLSYLIRGRFTVLTPFCLRCPMIWIIGETIPTQLLSRITMLGLLLLESVYTSTVTELGGSSAMAML